MGLGSRKPSGPADKLCINRPDTGPYLTQELCHNKSLANTEPSTQDIQLLLRIFHAIDDRVEDKPLFSPVVY